MQCCRKYAKQCSVILITALLASLFFSLVAFGQAVTTGTVNDNANLRVGPSTSYAIAGAAGQGTIVTVVGKDDTGEWYHLDNGQWIAAFLVDGIADIPAATPIATPSAQASQQPVMVPTSVVVSYDANLRAGPDTTFPIVGHANAGQVLVVIGKNTDSTWYQLVDQAWIAAFLAIDSNTQSGNEAQAPTTQQIDNPTPTATATPIPPPTPQPAPTENPLKGQRYGAICADGATSGATGRGACSHHGGVAQWLVYE